MVDLHPDNLLRSVYHPETAFDPNALIAMDQQIDFLREKKREQFDCLEMSNAEFEQQIRRELPYNCEHVIPQSWFGHNAPMVGDLHHLFACELVCIAFRQNYPYYDFQGYGTNDFDKPRCGLVDNVNGLNEQKFKPIENKGAVARAVLYFLVRYPGIIGNRYKFEDVAMLVRWHENNPVTLYELHRNQSIYKLQGNRNPFVDFPELAANVDFRHTFDLKSTTNTFSTEITPQDETAANEFGGAGVNLIQDCPVNPSAQWNVWRCRKSEKIVGTN
ncbi:endonuclease I family protein [Dyadobacter fermentans]|uniref:endonuclease I family protein n=1 Tax=Dyadobacter fermentans TaxID=94254 RepID=UPI0002D92FCF|nr:endonuclease [Dyadobacter fermentans]